MKRLIGPIYLPVFFVATGLSASVPGFPQYVGALGADLAAVGVLVSLLGIGNVLADLPAGAFVHKFGGQRIILFACMLSGLAALGTAVTASLFLIAVFRVAIGLSHAAVLIGTMAYVRGSIPAHKRGRALAFAGGAVRLGFFAGPTIGGFVTESAGLPATFLVQAAMAATAVASLVIFGRLKESPAQKSPGEPKHAAVNALNDVLRRRGPQLLVVAFSIFTLMLMRRARDIILPLWGTHLGLGVSTIGAVVGASAGIELLLFAPAGWLIDNAGRRPTMALCLAVMAAAIMALRFATGGRGYLVAALAIGLGNGFGSGIVMTLGTDFAPDKAVGPFLGLWRLFGDSGSAVGPIAVGALAAALTLPASLLITGGLGLCAAMTMIAFGPETRDNSTRTASKDTPA